MCSIGTTLLGCDRIDPQISAAKTSLESGLVDPRSVEYRNLRRYADGTVCGQYNAKNRMGGYTGFESFIYWQGQQISQSHVSDNLVKLCSDDKDKVEVVEEKLDVDVKLAAKKYASARVYLYVDGSNPLLLLDKREAIQTKVKQVFDGRERKEFEGDQLNTALLNAFASDKDLMSIKRVKYSVW